MSEQLTLFDWPRVQRLPKLTEGNRYGLTFHTKDRQLMFNTSSEEEREKIYNYLMDEWYGEQEIF
jgi:hypothetical protein